MPKSKYKRPKPKPHRGARKARVEILFELTRNEIRLLADGLTAANEKLDRMETRLTSIEKRLESLELRVTVLEQRLSDLEQRLTVLEDRGSRLEQTVLALKSGSQMAFAEN
jgi:chromosome segregation ATPase